MKMYLKRGTALFLSLLLALGCCTTSFAASNSSKKKISTIKLSVDMADSAFDDDKMTKDDLDSIIDISDSNANYYIESLSFADGSSWKYGKSATIKVVLEVDDEDAYRFYGVKGENVKISGSKYVESVSASGSGKRATVRLKMKAYVGDMDAPEEIYWSGKTAHWEKVSGANQYNVRLYHGGSAVATVSTTGTSFDLYPGMKASGKYTFRVQAENTSAGKTSKWSERSDELTIADNTRYTGTGSLVSLPASQQEGGSEYQGITGAGVGQGPTAQAVGGWIFDGIGWRYLEHGSAVAGSWRFVDNEWYHFDQNGYMQVGWINDGGFWYYLNPISDGTRGAMKTGWIFDGAHWYFLNPYSNGYRGMRMTGFQRIEGRDYYFDVNTGILATNCRVPDGRWAGADGSL